MLRKKVDEKNAEYYYAQAEAHKKMIKEQWRSFFSVGVFIVAAIMAFIALGVAWFVNNNRVSAESVAISAKYSGIEIVSKGSKGVHDDWLQKINAGITYHLPGESEGAKHDTSIGTSINWLLSESSSTKDYYEGNAHNYYEGKLFDETGRDQREDFAIEPGTKGTLDFFIRSNDGGDLYLDFSLDIIPFKVENIASSDEQYSIVQDDTETKLLSGHILYFLKTKTGTGTTETIEYKWLPDGKFNIIIPNAEKNKEYEYSIYWVWPLNLGSVLLNVGDTFLNGHAVEFDDIDSSGQIRNTIISDMEKSPEKYFFSSLTGLPLTTSYDEVKAIPDIHRNSGSSVSYDKQFFVDLSSYYNQADMEIGKHISFIEVTLRYLGKTEVANDE